MHARGMWLSGPCKVHRTVNMSSNAQLSGSWNLLTRGTHLAWLGMHACMQFDCLKHGVRCRRHVFVHAEDVTGG